MNSTHTLSTITTQVSRLGLTDTAHIKGSLVLSVVLVTDITFTILLLVPHFSKCFWGETWDQTFWTWTHFGLITGLTLKCQLKRYLCCHHVLLLLLLLCYLKILAGNSKFELEKFRIFGGKFKCKMQNAKLKYKPKPKIFGRT